MKRTIAVNEHENSLQKNPINDSRRCHVLNRVEVSTHANDGPETQHPKPGATGLEGEQHAPQSIQHPQGPAPTAPGRVEAEQFCFGFHIPEPENSGGAAPGLGAVSPLHEQVDRAVSSISRHATAGDVNTTSCDFMREDSPPQLQEFTGQDEVDDVRDMESSHHFAQSGRGRSFGNPCAEPGQGSALKGLLDSKMALPVLYLPSDVVTVRDSSIALMEELEKTGAVFSMNGKVVRLHDDSGVDYSLSCLSNKALPSFSQKFFRFHRKDWKENGEEILDLPRQFTAAHADAILACSDAVDRLPKIARVLSFPPVGPTGRLLEAGYHANYKLLVTSKVAIPKMTSAEGVHLLSGLLRDIRFASPGDRSRAIAAILGPMLRFAVGRPSTYIMPMFMVEADKSQTGKSHMIKMIGAIYGKDVTLIAQRKGGVGSLDESFNKALMDGNPLISFDNLRGKMDSTELESFVTASGRFNVRALRSDGWVDSRQFVIYGTSNNFALTPDLANRICVIRIRHQGEGYRWTEWPEGSLLEHVKVNSANYLGAVAAIVGQWIQDGMPQLECKHPQREWASAMNWIVQRIFDWPPLMEGHAELQPRAADYFNDFLAKIGDELAGREDTSLTVADMLLIAKNANFRLPVRMQSGDAKGEQLQFGGLLGRAFNGGDSLCVEGYRIERIETRKRRSDGDGHFASCVYRFCPTKPTTAATAATAATHCFPGG